MIVVEFTAAPSRRYSPLSDGTSSTLGVGRGVGGAYLAHLASAPSVESRSRFSVITGSKDQNHKRLNQIKAFTFVMCTPTFSQEVEEKKAGETDRQANKEDRNESNRRRDAIKDRLIFTQALSNSPVNI